MTSDRRSWWREDLAWADVVLTEPVTHPREPLVKTVPSWPLLPALLPAAVPGRTVRVGGWVVEPHWVAEVTTNFVRRGLFVVRFTDPDGWTGALAVPEKCQVRVPWQRLRARFPVLGRALHPAGVRAETAVVHEATLVRSLESLRAAMQGRGEWMGDLGAVESGYPVDHSRAALVSRWAEVGFTSAALVDAYVATAGPSAGPGPFVEVLDAGWVIEPDTLRWVSAALAGGWLDLHPASWRWGGLLALRESGWSVAGVEALHRAAVAVDRPQGRGGLGFRSRREWEARSGVEVWEQLVGARRASLFLVAGVGLDEVLSGGAAGMADEVLVVMGALRSGSSPAAVA